MSTATLYKGQTGEWEAVIGLEVHAQVKSQSKLFSGAPTAFGAEPNTQVSFIDAGFPGMLPVINKACVLQAIRMGLGLNAKINHKSIFDRKNYFYADLPQGYQISQYKHPIVGEGYLDIDISETETKRVQIERIHLEQDAGKSIHDQHPSKSYIDLNRSGVALMEIVTRPDLRSPEEAATFVRKLRALLRCLDTSDANMEQGNLRADVNVSIRKPGKPYGTRAEIKNMNSMRFITQAINYEIERQIGLLESGQEVQQETRLYDPHLGETRSMRTKEDAHDYRYFPDPDLPPLVVSEAQVEEIRKSLPELPDAMRARFIETFGLKTYDASVITADMDTAAFFEKAVEQLKSWKSDAPDQAGQKAVKTLANWLIVELFGLLNKDGKSLTDSPVTPNALAELVDLIQAGTLSGRMAKDVFAEMWTSGKDPALIVKEKGLEQVSDTGTIETCVDQVLTNNPKMLEDYKAGKEKLFGFFVGQVMKAMKGKANPQVVNEVLKQKLK